MKLLSNSFQSLIFFQKMLYYAVACGRKVGIYDTWSQCEEQVKHFKGAKYKKFPTRREAELFIKTENGSTSSSKVLSQFSPADIAIALGTVSSNRKESEREQSPAHYFWPESDGDGFSGENNNVEAELLSALYEVEGFEEKPVAYISAGTGKKRKMNEPGSSIKSKQLKHTSKVWEPCGLKRYGPYEFEIDSEGFVIVYTDGSCINNGRANAVAGFGVYFGDAHPLNIARPVHGRVTNNAGEIQATIHAIKVAKDVGIDKLCISTDSQFLINSITTWMTAWKSNNWRLKNGDPVKNVDDFKVLDKLYNDDSIEIKWNYVKAHRGIKGNEMADKLAREGSEIYRHVFLK